ncbi:cysteine desulfurase family protein [Oricola cellulosilytica]|uniref:Cysteine desulfurase n=1 Tax=Oricola cellulosilytica TaxID=1429082 RepID=A0A4R0P9S0_9HYPH|nr:cysteine desulfurase family protein [Oricola cellulosilytica]TCD12408.1 cysteine desulfurase [Oricola cellulosilytica]
MPTTRPSIYLDYNASAPLLPEARAAMMEALEIDANPSSVHRAGRAAKAAIQKARRSVATLAGAKPDHVVFTSGATEAAATLLTPHYSFGRSPLTFSKLYVCAADHPCTLAGGRFEEGDVVFLPVGGDGILDCEFLESALASHDKGAGLPLVAVHWANNETGVVQPIGKIAHRVKAHGGVLVVDAVQAIGRIPIDISDGCGDFLILSSHKIGGPKGAGALVAHSDLMMPLPLISGGGQERGHRSGTEAVANIAGFGAAADVAERDLEAFAEVAGLRGEIETAVREIAPDAVIHGENVPRLPNTVFFTIPGLKAETVQIAFDLAGVALSSGSACSSGKVGRSHVLKAMGRDTEEGGIRVSIGPSTTTAEIAEFSGRLREIAARARPDKTLERA